MSEENKIILYQDDNEITRVSVRFADEDLWLTQNQLAEIYCTTQQNISMAVCAAPARWCWPWSWCSAQ